MATSKLGYPDANLPEAGDQADPLIHVKCKDGASVAVPTRLALKIPFLKERISHKRFRLDVTERALKAILMWAHNHFTDPKDNLDTCVADDKWCDTDFVYKLGRDLRGEITMTCVLLGYDELMDVILKALSKYMKSNTKDRYGPGVLPCPRHSFLKPARNNGRGRK